VGLTFDAEHPDRPNAAVTNTARILDALAGASVRATFFVQGRWARSEPELLGRIVDDGHLVGNHSNYHARMTYLSDDGIRRDVSEAEATLRDLAGLDPRPWFRCPFGDGRADPRVLSALDELGYREVGWDVEVEDWEPWRTPAEIAEDVVKQTIAHGEGAVVLLHTWPGHTADAVPDILDRLAREGVRFVRVDEIDRVP
jgi:peptidoglycan/xylan/chitin deacetylase (PgdA/CDA1 family)